jgi:hypothetical protein
MRYDAPVDEVLLQRLPLPLAQLARAQADPHLLVRRREEEKDDTIRAALILALRVPLRLCAGKPRRHGRTTCGAVHGA